MEAQGPRSTDPGLIHVHGLGLNPKDGALFIATHTGLFRLAAGERNPERVAGRYQDTMAFTVVGPGRFLGSGHPDGRERLPPFLGLIESRDAGQSWRPVSLLGKVDFHLLEVVGRWGLRLRLGLGDTPGAPAAEPGRRAHLGPPPAARIPRRPGRPTRRAATSPRRRARAAVALG